MEAKSTKNEKVKVVEELREKFGRAGSVILTDYKGLSVAQLTEMRNRLRKCGAEYKVVKNTLARRASEGTDVRQIEGHFTRATGVVIGYEDIVAPVKVLSEYAGKFDSFKIRIGVLDGTVLDPAGIKGVANLPPKEVLLGKALGSIKSPLYGLAFTLQGVVSKLVYVLNALDRAKAGSQA